MNLRDLDLRIVTEPGHDGPPIARRRAEGLIKYESSAYLTSAHIDVTHSPAVYARPKAFRFPSRRQLRATDADRWVRQRLKATNLIAASELPPVAFSLDNLAALHRSPRFNRATVEFIHNALLSASRRLNFTGKVVR